MNVLYAFIIAKDPVEKVQKDLLTEIDDEEKMQFAIALIHKVIDNEEHLDKLIELRVKHWEYERVALLDKILMRMALAELLYFPEIPPKVSINEAIEIAKEYSTRSSGKFVNGVLDTVYINIKKDGGMDKKGRGLLDLKKKPEAEPEVVIEEKRKGKVYSKKKPNAQ